MNLKKMTLQMAAVAVLSLGPLNAHALDLLDAYEAALNHDPVQKAAMQTLRAGREKAVQGDALLRPRVSFQAGANYVDDHMSSGAPAAYSGLLPGAGTGVVRQSALQLSQPLYDQGARAGKVQLHLQSEVAQIEFEQASQNLVQRIAERYLDVLKAEENLRVVLATKSALGMQRDRAQARFNVGRGKVTDLHESQARYDQVLTQEVSARSTLELRRASLSELTGLPADDLQLQGLIPERAPSAPEPDNLTEWQQRGEKQNSQIRVRHAQRAAAAAEVEKYRLANRPTLNLVASYNNRAQSGGLSPLVSARSDRSATIGVQFTAPLYAGGGLDSKEREALAKQDEADDLLEAAKSQVRLQIQSAFLEVKTGVARVASVGQSLTSARSALAATTLGRDVGTRTELDVLDAQQRAFSAEFEYSQARLDYLLGQIRLAAATGELSADHLRTTNSWLRQP